MPLKAYQSISAYNLLLILTRKLNFALGKKISRKEVIVVLRSLRELRGYKIIASDGEIGQVHEFYFDDLNWNVQYMVADTGTWLNKQRVLIAPAGLGRADWEENAFHLNIARKQVEKSPPISADEPVSRQKQIKLLEYYDWPVYWAPRGPHVAGSELMATKLINAAKKDDKENLVSENDWDPHLRSTREVMGYKIHAVDDDIGFVEDFIVDDEIWKLKYLVVDTRKWLPGSKKVLISPDWIKDVDWLDSEVKVKMDSDSIKNCPEFDPGLPVNAEYETELYDYYGRPVDK